MKQRQIRVVLATRVRFDRKIKLQYGFEYFLGKKNFLSIQEWFSVKTDQNGKKNVQVTVELAIFDLKFVMPIL